MTAAGSEAAASRAKQSIQYTDDWLANQPVDQDDMSGSLWPKEDNVMKEKETAWQTAHEPVIAADPTAKWVAVGCSPAAND